MRVAMYVQPGRSYNPFRCYGPGALPQRVFGGTGMPQGISIRKTLYTKCEGSNDGNETVVKVCDRKELVVGGFVLDRQIRRY